MKIYKGFIIETICHVCNHKFTEVFKKNEIKERMVIMCPRCFTRVKVENKKGVDCL